MKALLTLTLVAGLILTAGCADDTLSAIDHEVTYEVELRFSDDHVATLDHVEIEVFVRDENGNLTTAIPEIAVEHRLEGTTDWAAISLAVHEDHYAAEYEFMSSGEHEFRVMGAIDEIADHLEEMYVMPGHLEIERAHMEMDGLEISYEHFPGDLHEGAEVELRFWVESMAGSMMPGLSATITANNPDGSSASHAADEHEAGVYEALHTFASAGEATVMVEFMQGGMVRQASFGVHVNEAH